MLFRINDTLSSIKSDTHAMAPLGTGAAHRVASQTELTAPVEEPTRDAATNPAAGWYDDTERPGHKRWWDGTAWGARDDDQPASGEPDKPDQP